MICRKCGNEGFEYETKDDKPTGLCYSCVSDIVVDWLKKKQLKDEVEDNA